MASLGETVAALASRRWTPDGSDASVADLQEVTAFGDNPGELRMLVHTPAMRTALAPLVVVLHGCTQTAAGYAEGAGWRDLADRYGFVLLCPEQTRANNMNLCFNWFQPGDMRRGAGEAASIHAMVLQAVADYGLDPRRIFVTGLSAGGAMANVMLAAYPETFAGGAIIAGLAYGAASNMQEAFAAMRGARASPPRNLGAAVRSASGHKGRWPRISIWQGDADATVAPAAADDLAEQWREVHGVEAAAAERRTSGQWRSSLWRDTRGETVVELHQLGGMGHGAPLGCGLDEGCGKAGPYLLEVGVSSTLEIARSWGLAPSQKGRRAAPKAAVSTPPGTRRDPQATAAPPLRVVGSVVGDVITDALRSAGLLR